MPWAFTVNYEETRAYAIAQPLDRSSAALARLGLWPVSEKSGMPTREKLDPARRRTQSITVCRRLVVKAREGFDGSFRGRRYPPLHTKPKGRGTRESEPIVL